MRFIPLTNSRFSIIVDDDDYDRVIALNTKWWLKICGRETSKSIRSTRNFNGKKINLARFIHKIDYCNYPLIDHKFGDIFDNRKAFTREATDSQNSINRRKSKLNTSGYIGVSFHTRKKKWMVQGVLNKIRKHVGYFDIKEDAARAYDEFAKKHYGEFAVLNFK